jgi:phosphoglycerate kinase
MAYTFASSQGRSIGSSLFNSSFVSECAAILSRGNVLIPSDARGLSDGSSFGAEGGDDPVVEFGANIPDGFEGLDIGPKSVRTSSRPLRRPRRSCGTARWASLRTAASARAPRPWRAPSPRRRGVGRGRRGLGGGPQGLRPRGSFSFVSTGGGASLEFVELGDLPGLRPCARVRSTR